MASAQASRQMLARCHQYTFVTAEDRPGRAGSLWTAVSGGGVTFGAAGDLDGGVKAVPPNELAHSASAKR